MILPIGDDNPKETVPYVHYCIMAVNVVVFFHSVSLGHHARGVFFTTWGLVPAEFSISRVFTSMYMHGGLAHIFGNMLFLWIVGDNVEDRLGHVGYFIFYHLAGVVACLAHVAFSRHSQIPLIGASGAISGMIGAYAVFFPNAKIKIWYWIFFVFTDVIYVSAKWAVGLWFLGQLLLWQIAGDQGVAYGAHVGGIVFGVVVAFVLQKALLGKPDSVRRIVRPARGRAGPRWKVAGGEEWDESEWALPVEAEVHDATAASAAAAGVRTRADDNIEIPNALEAADLHLAYRCFTRATSGYRPVVLHQAIIMRLGEALLTAGRYGPAARVYEVMVETYPEGEDAPEAAFRLGTILSREFKDYARARTYLIQARQTHGDGRRTHRAEDELKRIDAYLRSTLLSRRSASMAWIIRQTGEPIDISRVSQFVAERLGMSVIDVSTRLRASRGIIARDVPMARAEALANELQAINIPVLLIPSHEIKSPPAAAVARRVRLSTQGVRFELRSRVVHKTWDEAELISCGCIRSGGKSYLAVDLFFGSAEASAHLRVREEQFAFIHGDAPGCSQRDVAAFCRTLQQLAEHATMNPGMYLVEKSLHDPEWKPLRFDSEREFDQYNLWFLQLTGPGKMPPA